MAFTILAVVVGMAAGLASGGRFSRLGEHSFRGLRLLAVGVALQAGAGLAGGHLGFPVVLLSYLLLLGFVGANLRIVGMGIVALGLALNAFVIAINGGMAVRPSSIVSAHAATAAEVGRLHLEGKHHLATASDHLVLLSDAVPLTPLHEVVSFGDLILSVGAADVLANLLRSPRRRVRRQRRRPAHARAAPGITAAWAAEPSARWSDPVHGGRDDLAVDLTSSGRRKVALPS